MLIFLLVMEEKEVKRTDEQTVKSWLDSIQQDSWQLELLISGFSIFLLIGAGQWLQSLEYDLVILQQAYAKFFGLDVLYYCFRVAWACLITCLFLHVVLRGLWVAAVGLRSVSGDIDYDSFKFVPRFLNRLRKGISGFDDYVDRLERYCSTIFSYAFLIIFCFIGLAIFVSIGGLLTQFVSWLAGDDYYAYGSYYGDAFGLIYFLIGVIYAIDFISLGYLKRFRWLAKPYYYCYIVMGWITLARFYRPLYYNLIDNRFGRRLARLLPIIILVVLAVSSVRYSRYAYIPGVIGDGSTFIDNNSYDDAYDNKIMRSWRISLNSRYAHDNYIELFIPYIPINDDDNLRLIDSTIRPARYTGMYLDGAFSLGSRNKAEVDHTALLAAFQEKYRLHVNDSLSTVYPRFFKHKDRQQYGLLYAIPVHSLPPGEHSLRVDIRKYLKDTVAYSTGRYLYFYK